MMKRYVVSLAAMMSIVTAGAQTVTPQACEQSIVTPKAEGRYLWLPVQESAPEGKVQVIVSGSLQTEQNVRMARERVDYYVALDLLPYRDKGALRVCVQNVPTGSVCFSKLAQNDDAAFALIRERHRPLYHHTPERGWMNDPNGMFYKDGVWHLYYQYNPYGSMWGNMHWGHSSSADLIHWKDEGVALAPDVWGTMFSGSCVTQGERVVAMYTSSRPTPFGADVQAQCLAFSDDGGKTFSKYEGNPVLTGEDPDFRDPRPFWNEDIRAWNLILAVGQEMRIYSSPDLKAWTYESSFGRDFGSHGGVWECPDLFPLTSASGVKRWVLVCNINPGGPFGGSGTQYFVGQFDGHRFTVDNPDRYAGGKALWLDYGKDHYAAVSFCNAPDARRTMLAWMSNWQYANQVPTMQFRSANSIPRDLGLFEYQGDTYVASVPSGEMLSARGSKVRQPLEACEIVVDLKKHSEIVLSNPQGEQLVMRYDAVDQTFSMDRTKSGNVGFSADFPCVTVAPTYGAVKQLRIFIDRSSVEVFDADGKMAMTNLVFPSEPYNSLSVKGGKATIYEIK
ncbi:MAG: GH32 C-terminal domain-containing protein [Bacteroidaceae bacterium]|nr:GH32 C-terminal domain-containing protein [Bacteroidaceae bacterium]